MQKQAPKAVFSPGPSPETVRDSQGNVVRLPTGWSLLAPGDAALTRRVKAAGDHILVQEKKGRRTFSRGVWAPDDTIASIRGELECERAKPSFARRQQADAARRAKVQAEYVDEFHQSIVEYLDFHPSHADLAARVAQAVTTHATPVGSGTVARTKRIPVEQRAEAAVIAWMRHQTTGYDNMKIARQKGRRREVRRMLAERSKKLLVQYRKGMPITTDCPLMAALRESTD